MTAPASEDLREVERELTVAAEQGETRSIEYLREELGIGTMELTGMLDVLREHGKAVEEAPGEWRGPTADEVDPPADPPRVVVRADVAEELEAVRRDDGRDWTPAAMLGSAAPNVRLTMAIAEALDAAALGQLVKAAIEGLDRGEPFILEITP